MLVFIPKKHLWLQLVGLCVACVLTQQFLATGAVQ